MSSIIKQKLQNNNKIKGSVKGHAYANLALLIKQKISTGIYQPDSKIPAETALAQTYSVSVMTVRQAIGLLVEQGILRREHGIGTFVCSPDWTKASFNMEGLLELFNDNANINIRIIKAGIIEAGPKAAAVLGLPVGSLIIKLIRLVSYKGEPFLLNNAHLKFDPKSPIVESELEVSSLSGLFSGEGNSFIKKVLLKLDPCILSNLEAKHLKAKETTPAFKIRYTFYDYNDSPVGSGWFMIPINFISFTTKIGVWDDD